MYRPGSSLSKAKTNKASNSTGIGLSVRNTENKVPTLEDYLKSRDWIGAIACLENEKSFNDAKAETNLWLAYCCFHNGDYKKSIQIYEQLLK